jgi:lipoprotein-releasing system ATP-binding protein
MARQLQYHNIYYYDTQGLFMAITLQNLDKEYVTRSGPLPVLRGVNLSIEPGQALAITGPSGSGKSTLLHILGTLDQPTRGSYLLDQADPFSLKDADLARFRNQRIGFIFQEHHLLPQCSVLENVLIPTLVDPNNKPKEVEDFARQLLKRVGLADRLEHRPAELSGGERQRVAIARSLIRKPKLLLADEPTGNLDRKTAQSVGELLFELHREQKTILIVVTHSQDLAKVFPLRYEMSDGQLLKI